jgi:hypothetical protein
MALTPDRARSMRARRGGIARAKFWRELGFPNLKLAVEARKRRCAERRALGLIGATWAKRLRRKGIFVGDVATTQLEPMPQAAIDPSNTVEAPLSVEPSTLQRPMIVIDAGARGLTLAQLRRRGL